jgi:hypothetical protein
MTKLSGREREARLIRRANRAAMVGRLMLGELYSWHQFLEADAVDLEALPRRNLKAALSDVRSRLTPEIRSFCSKNFRGMDERKLSLLYEEIKAYRGLELPLPEFEERFASVRREVLRGNPAHLTIAISLWGLQFKFPEGELAKDLTTALRLVLEAHNEANQYRTKRHIQLRAKGAEIGSLMRKEMFAVRSAILICFNLVEAYLNGLAWDYVQTHGTASLSNRTRKLLEDTTSVSLQDKLRKYPRVLIGRELWEEPDEELDGFISIFKPYRDSLVHPSPFSAPERFGGYDKLRLFYRVDYDTAMVTAALLVSIVRRIHEHVYGDVSTSPEWMCQLESEVKDVSEQLLS